jgi:hypothetical protein
MWPPAARDGARPYGIRALGALVTRGVCGDTGSLRAKPLHPDVAGSRGSSTPRQRPSGEDTEQPDLDALSQFTGLYIHEFAGRRHGVTFTVTSPGTWLVTLAAFTSCR